MYEVEVDAVGKQIGTKENTTSNMTWSAKFEGGARVVDFDALSRALGVGGLPDALQSMSLDIFFKAEVVGRCRSTVSKPELKARLVSAISA